MSLFLCVFLSMLAPNDDYARGKELLDRGKPAEALPFIEEAVMAHPGWYYPLLLRGTCKLKLKQYDAAITDFSDADSMDLKPEERASVRFYLGRSLMAAKQYTRAADTFESVVEDAPEGLRFNLMLNAAQCALQLAKTSRGAEKQQHYRTVITRLDKALAQPGNQKLRGEAVRQQSYARLQVFLGEGEGRLLEEGISDLSGWLKDHPGDLKVHELLVTLHHQRAQKGDSPDHYREMASVSAAFLKHRPNDTAMLKKHGAALSGAERYSDAASTMEKLIQLSPTDAQAHYMLAAAQYKLGRYNQAGKAFVKATETGMADKADCYRLGAACTLKQKTGCDVDDLQTNQRAAKILALGLSRVKPEDKATLQGELDRINQNLSILKQNQQADEINHKAVLKDIPNILGVLSVNRDKETRIKEQILDNPSIAEELRLRLDEVRSAVTAGEVELDKAYVALAGYVASAKRCGAEHYPQFQAMKDLLAARK